MIIPDVYAWTVVLSLSTVFVGVSGFALYVAVFTQVNAETEWTGRVLMYYGRGLILLTIASAIVGVLASLVAVPFAILKLAS